VMPSRRECLKYSKKNLSMVMLVPGRECPKCGRCLFTTDLYVLGASVPFCLAICITVVVSAYVSYIGETSKTFSQQFVIILYTDSPDIVYFFTLNLYFICDH
jgi:hypothetical protein